MNDTLNRFNWIAPHYDAISRVVFGKALYDSQIWALKSIPPGGAILILGGGSGAILPVLLRLNPSCKVWFVEASSNMVAGARGALTGEEMKNVTFIHGTEKSILPQLAFDAIITNFLLDLFPDHQTAALCRHLVEKLKCPGLWLVSDFVDGGKWWQRFLLWTMYRFFIVTCKIGASKLPAWEEHLRSVGLAEKSSKYFYGDFIKTIVYQRQTSSS